MKQRSKQGLQSRTYTSPSRRLNTTNYDCPTENIRYHYTDSRESLSGNIEELFWYVRNDIKDLLTKSNYDNSKTLAENIKDGLLTINNIEKVSNLQLLLSKDPEFRELSNLINLIFDVHNANTIADARNKVQVYVDSIKDNPKFQSRRFLKNEIFSTFFIELMYQTIIIRWI